MLKQGQEMVEQGEAQLWSADNAMIMGIVCLGFTLLLFGLFAWLLTKKVPATSLLRLFTVPLVCVLAVFLVVMGYRESQIAPAIGLLGTVVGYLLGKGEDKHDNNEK